MPNDDVIVDTGLRTVPQKSVEWCWLGNRIGVATWLKAAKIPTEAELANAMFNRTDCGNSPIPDECIRPGPPELMGNAYMWLGIEFTYSPTPLTEERCIEELLEGRGFEAGIEWAIGGGHVILVSGYDKLTRMFQIEDPWNGRGRLPYQLLLNGYGNGRWVLSFGRFSLKKTG